MIIPTSYITNRRYRYFEEHALISVLRRLRKRSQFYLSLYPLSLSTISLSLSTYKNERVHLYSHWTSRYTSRQCLLGTLLPRTRNSGIFIPLISSSLTCIITYYVYFSVCYVNVYDMWLIYCFWCICLVVVELVLCVFYVDRMNCSVIIWVNCS